MPIFDISNKNVVTIEAQASLQAACELMKDQHVGALVVIEKLDSTRPLGLITDRDIVLKMAEHFPLSTSVGKVMSIDVVSIPADEGLSRAVERMRASNVRRLLLTDEMGRACGILSVDDVIRLLATELKDLGNLIEGQPWQEGTRRESITDLLQRNENISSPGV